MVDGESPNLISWRSCKCRQAFQQMVGTLQRPARTASGTEQSFQKIVPAASAKNGLIRLNRFVSQINLHLCN
jgi:hypothetical protein